MLASPVAYLDLESRVRSRLEGLPTQWAEIRERFPHQWLLVEAVEAHSDEGKRVLDDIAVIRTFPDSVAAMKSYQELHRRDRQKEMYVLHTDRERLDIGEIFWFGLRTAS